MPQLQIDVNPMFTLDITVRESDQYTESVFVKFERNMDPGRIQGCNEMFITPDQLDQLGRFFIRQAKEITSEQFHRNIN